MEIHDLVAQAQAAYGWSDVLDVSPGPRGALGQVWRFQVGSELYAVKEIFDEAPTESSIGVELSFADRARAEGVRVPVSHPDRDGRYLLTTPHGTWLRCYEWVDVQSLALGAPDTPARLGALLGRLHRCAPATAVEPNGGGPPDPWYETTPAVHEWADICKSDASWAGLLSERLPTWQELCAIVGSTDPARLILCHRDLHPENVLSAADGDLVVVDWDDLGPADPSRELARVVFDWFCDEDNTDLDGVRAMVEAYVAERGPARITSHADFSMLVACRLNFLLSQAQIATDPRAEERDRRWAEQEVALSLHIMPTVAQMDLVLAATARD